jgi:hypothetical protein
MPDRSDHQSQSPSPDHPPLAPDAFIGPLTNYTLSTVCPACTAPTYRLACKVRCPRCGFVWDCSEI